MHCYPNHTRLMWFNLISDIQIIYAGCISLLILDISGLYNVKKIWDNHLPQDSFSQLKEVNVVSCGEVLKRLHSLGDLKVEKNLFPASLIEDLVELQKLYVRGSRIEEIVGKDNGIETIFTFMFPKVATLQLYALPELGSLYAGAGAHDGNYWKIWKWTTVTKYNKHILDCDSFLGRAYCEKM